MRYHLILAIITHNYTRFSYFSKYPENNPPPWQIKPNRRRTDTKALVKNLIYDRIAK